MQSKRRTTAVALTGAVGLASVAYGLGSQANDGSAVAGGESRNGGPRVMFECGAPPGFSDLADTLGVKASELRQAMLDFHEQRHDDRRAELAAALAKALDLPVDRVTAALDELHENLEGRMEKRREAFRDGPPPPGRAHRIALPLRQLASALDVSRAELRKAFQEIRPDREDPMEDRFEEHTEALAKFLAERFNLDVDKVSDALADLPRPAPPPHGVRPGPGGPGAFGPAG
jgi:hypothetical protein